MRWVLIALTKSHTNKLLSYCPLKIQKYIYDILLRNIFCRARYTGKRLSTIKIKRDCI